MANVLQVNSSPSPDRVDSGVDPRAAGISSPGQVQAGQQVAPVGNAGQGSQSGQVGAEGTGTAAIDFESNYAAFVRQLLGSETLNEDLSALLFGDGAELLQNTDPAVQQDLQTIYQSIRADTPEELLELMKTQSGGQTIYGSELFDAVRSYLAENPGQIGQESMIQFLRAYQNMAAGSHLLSQMDTIAGDIRSLILPNYRGQFEDVMGQLNLAAPNGDTGANTQVINQQIIPFLSSYVARTHDYGAVRKAAVLFSLYAVQYENGDRQQVMQTFGTMLRNGDFRMLLQDDPGKMLEESLEAAEKPDDKVMNLSKAFSGLMLRGSQGVLGTQGQEKCNAAISSMLANESVYMPIRHMLLPFRYRGRSVMSEMWIDPDAGQDGNGTLSRMFIKYNIEKLGNFDLVATWQRRNVKVQLFVPDAVTDLREPRRITSDVRQILQDNGLNSEVTMFRRMRELSLMEVFPDLKEKERTVNLQV